MRRTFLVLIVMVTTLFAAWALARRASSPSTIAE
jgi:hypothetical protein